MARNRGGNLSGRVADLERRRDRVHGGDRPRVIIHLPRKDNDTRPPGTISDAGGVRVVLYEPQRTTANGRVAERQQILTGV